MVDDARSSVAVFGRDPEDNKKSLYAVTSDGRLAEIWDTDRWTLDFPAESAGYPDLRFTGNPAVFGRDPAGNKKSMYAVTSDGRLVEIWDTDRWTLDFPAQRAGHPDLRFTGSPAVFGRDSAGNRKSLYAVTTDGRLAQIWDTPIRSTYKWNLDFPAERAGPGAKKIRFTSSPAVFGRDPEDNKKSLYAVTSNGRLAEIWDTHKWYAYYPVGKLHHFTGNPAVFGRDPARNEKSMYAVTTDGWLAEIWEDTDRRYHPDFPAESAGYPDLRFTGSPAVFGRDPARNKKSLYAVTTNGRLAQIWDTERRWTLDFPAEDAGYPELRFQG